MMESVNPVLPAASGVSNWKFFRQGHLCPFDAFLVFIVAQLFVCPPSKISENLILCLALWVKFSADVILKYFSYFSQKTGINISYKLSPMETICIKCQILFSGKIGKI